MKKKQRNEKRFTIITLINAKKIMKNTQFNVEYIFGDIINKDNIRQDQIIKLNKLLVKMI